MRVAAILGLGCSSKDLRPFQTNAAIDWIVGMPETAGDANVILLFGGDGTIHRHLPQLVKLGLPILIVPAGSGNDFARALGLRRVRDSLVAWQRFCTGDEKLQKIDLGTISGAENATEPPLTTEIPSSRKNSGKWGTPSTRYFACVAGVGLDAEVSRRANQLPRWLRGNGGYAFSLLPTIFSFAPFPMRISTRGESQNGWTVRSNQPTLMAAFANTSTYGDGMKIAPGAKIDDGLLEVCVVGGVDPFKLFCMFPTVYSGRHLSIKEVQYFKSSWVRIETERPLDVYADGEYVCRTPVEISIERAVLKVIIAGS
jgi:diacylglycerol kinase (ATP)